MSEVKLKPTGGGAGSISLKAPAATTNNADYPLVFPADDGSADQYLKTNGSGALSWATVSTGEQDASTGDYTLTSGNLVIATNGKGIDFAANTDDEGAAGSVSAEVLNDYEVGTFTPTIDDGSATFGYHTQTGNYIKIGDLVHIELYIRLSSSSGTSANKIHIGGLPFSSATAHNAMRVGYTYGIDDDDSPRIGRVNGNQIECFKNYAHSSSLYNAVFDGGDERITFSVTYRTS